MTGIDADDAATATPRSTTTYSSNLTADGLRDKRIGVLRSYYGAGSNPHVEAILTASILALKAQGAEIIDNIEYRCGRTCMTAEYEVLLYEFRADLNAYFEKSGAPIREPCRIDRFNDANAEAVMPIFGQDIISDGRGRRAR